MQEDSGIVKMLKKKQTTINKIFYIHELNLPK